MMSPSLEFFFALPHHVVDDADFQVVIVAFSLTLPANFTVAITIAPIAFGDELRVALPRSLLHKHAIVKLALEQSYYSRF